MVCVDDGVVSMMLCWWRCVDDVVLMVMCWCWCHVLMVLCRWCCVDGDVLMRSCCWCCVDDVVEMVLCWWWCVWCCSVDGVVWMALQVLHLLRKMSLRSSKCCTCHAYTQSSPDFRGPLRSCSQCCTCHAKKWSWGAPSAAPATKNEAEVLQVLHLPRKSSRRP